MTTARRAGPLRVSIVLAAAVVIGVIIAVLVNRWSDDASNSHSVAALKAAASKVPLPAGATLTDETSNGEHGDLNSYLQREYHLSGSAQSTAQIKAALEQGGCRVIDVHGGESQPIGSTLWAEQTSADSGDVNVLPPGLKGGGIELNWQGSKLVLRVSGGDVEPD